MAKTQEWAAQGTVVCARRTGRLSFQFPSLAVKASSEAAAVKRVSATLRRGLKAPKSCAFNVHVERLSDVMDPGFYREDRLTHFFETNNFAQQRASERQRKLDLSVSRREARDQRRQERTVDQVRRSVAWLLKQHDRQMRLRGQE